MYTAEALLDLHRRAHISLGRLMTHCDQFSPEELNRQMDGFGFPSILQQLHHLIGGEEYWIEVLKGSVIDNDDSSGCPSLGSLEAYRQRVFAATEMYLRSAPPAELNAARQMLTWGGKESLLVPAHVFMRTLTHIYQHQGQIIAMCRLLGRPAAGMDFPLAPDL